MLTDILKEKWSPALSVSTILVSLQSLLGGASRACRAKPSSLREPRRLSGADACGTRCTEPNNASPLNVEASELWDNVEAVRAFHSAGVSDHDKRFRSDLISNASRGTQYKLELAKHYRPLEDDE